MTTPAAAERDLRPGGDVSLDGRLGRNLAALAGSQAITWSMTLAWTIVVPRALGPAGLGLIVAALSVSGIAGIVLGLGTKTYLVREIVVRPGSAAALVGTALVLRVLLAPAFGGVIVAYAIVSGVHGDAALVLGLMAAATFLALVMEPLQAVFQAAERMEFLAYGDVVSKSAQALLGIALALVGVRAPGMAALAVCVAVVVVLLDLRWLSRIVRVRLRTTLFQVRSVVRGSLAYWAFGVFFVLYLSIDTVMLSLLTTPTEVGWYGVPTRLFQTLMFLPAIVGTAWLPRLVAANERGIADLRAAARTPIGLVVGLALPICAATITCSAPVIHLLYGAAYAHAVPVMIVLGACLPPMYLNIMLNQVLVATGRQSAWTWAMLAAVIANPALNLVLVRWTDGRFANGAIGAALSLLATEVGIVAIGLVLVGPTVLAGLRTTRFARVSVASLVLLAASLVARPLGTVGGPVTGLAAFAVACLALRLVTPSDLRSGPAVVRRALRARG